MLTSFFGKSIPLIHLILAFCIVAGYVFFAISGSSVVLTPYGILVHTVFIILSVLSILVLDFIIRKNQLTKTNTYAILFFTSFILMLPVIFLEHDILLANLFLLLALRRIMSLRRDTNSSKKILDASVWITIASLFYFWSLLFFIPLWIAVIQKPNSDFKQMLAPITGFLGVLIINSAVQLLITDSFSWFFTWKKEINLDFSSYNLADILVPITFILGFYFWTGFFRITRLSTVSLKNRSNYLLLFYVSITALFVALLGPKKTGAEILFVLAPIAIIAANYIENYAIEQFAEKDKAEIWFKEIMLWLVVILPFVFLFL